MRCPFYDTGDVETHSPTQLHFFETILYGLFP